MLDVKRMSIPHPCHDMRDGVALSELSLDDIGISQMNWSRNGGKWTLPSQVICTHSRMRLNSYQEYEQELVVRFAIICAV